MKKLLSFLLLTPFLTFGQESGVYNGEITEHAPDYYLDYTCPAFKSVINWLPTNGIPSYNASQGSLEMTMSWNNYYNIYQGNGVCCSYYFEEGKTYIIEFGVYITSTVPNTAGFIAFASPHRGFAYTSQTYLNLCEYEYREIDPSEEKIIGVYNAPGTTTSGYVNVQMEYICESDYLDHIWINPILSDTGKATLGLDYVRVRTCGSGTLNLNNVVTQGNYLKENINAGTNVQTSTSSSTNMTGQIITLNPGFSSSPTSGGLFVATAVTTCNLPHDIFDPGKPGRDNSNNSSSLPNETELSAAPAITPSSIKGVTVYPNPAKDNLNIEYFISQNSDVSFDVLDLSGRGILSKTIIGLTKGNQKTTLDLSNLLAGTYLLKITTSDGRNTQKFVVR